MNRTLKGAQHGDKMGNLDIVTCIGACVPYDYVANKDRLNTNTKITQ